MGAYSPAPVVTPEVHARVMREVVNPTVQGMIKDGMPFTGFLYAGLMIDKAGAPKVIEFNVRFGDPETQPVMLRLQSDLLDLVEAAIDERLHATTAHWSPRPSLGVVMAAENYRAPHAPAMSSTPGMPPTSKAPRSSMPARRSKATTSSPPAVACCACAPWATASPTRRAKPTPRWRASPGTASSIATTSAGARSSANRRPRRQQRATASPTQRSDKRAAARGIVESASTPSYPRVRCAFPFVAPFKASAASPARSAILP